LREAQEELGIPPDYVEVMGFLPEVWTPTGFCIIPVVGVLRTVPPLVPSVQEVAEVFRVPLKFFAQPGRMEQRIVAGSLREVWFYDFEEKVIWGATALMIRMLLEKIGPPTALRP
jgi:8-oxo-dGTP pyrophosphatase MutT (NUDIX family)